MACFTEVCEVSLELLQSLLLAVGVDFGKSLTLVHLMISVPCWHQLLLQIGRLQGGMLSLEVIIGNCCWGHLLILGMGGTGSRQQVGRYGRLEESLGALLCLNRRVGRRHVHLGLDREDLTLIREARVHIFLFLEPFKLSQDALGLALIVRLLVPQQALRAGSQVNLVAIVLRFDVDQLLVHLLRALL